MDKPDLRRQFLRQRHMLDDALFQQKNDKLVAQVIDEINWRQVRTMHCFLPLMHDHEPDLREVIEFAMRRGVSVFTSDPSTKTGRQVEKLHDGRLQEQLHQLHSMNERVLDVIIIPMLAYDPRTNHRLGFGGGFYDRLLALQPHAVKIGVCFSEFVVDLPVEPHDQPLDVLLTA